MLELIAATTARAKRGVRPTAQGGGHLSHPVVEEVEARFDEILGAEVGTAPAGPGRFAVGRSRLTAKEQRGCEWSSDRNRCRPTSRRGSAVLRTGRDGG